MLGGGGEGGLAGHERKVSVVKVFRQLQSRLNSKSVFFISITLVQCSAAKPYPSSVQQIGKRTNEAMKLHQHFDFGPASQDPFSFCQIQLALETVYSKMSALKKYSKFKSKWAYINYSESKNTSAYMKCRRPNKQVCVS